METDLNKVELELALSNGREIEVRHTASVPRITDHVWYLTTQQKNDLRGQIAHDVL